MSELDDTESPMTEPGISFSIVTHNRADMLTKTLASIARGAVIDWGLDPDGNDVVLRPKTIDYEIIIVDDGSTDPLAISRLAEYETGSRCRVLRKDHDLQMPESWARNVSRGLAASRYDIVWHFDDDTLIDGPTGWASKIADMLRTHPEVGTLAPFRRGIMEPFVPWKDGIELSFGLTEPCFAMRREVFDQIGPMDESLRWFFGPDYSLRVMEAGFECCFWKGARQLDLCPRTGMPQDTFPRADGGPYMKKWCDKYGVGEHAWPPFVRHRDRVKRGSR